MPDLRYKRGRNASEASLRESDRLRAEQPIEGFDGKRYLQGTTGERQAWADPATAEQAALRHAARVRTGWYDRQPNGAAQQQRIEELIKSTGGQQFLDKDRERMTDRFAPAAPQTQFVDPSGFEFNINEDMLLGPSALEGVQADPRAIAAQHEALNQLSQWGQGEVTDADRAMYDFSNLQNRQQADQMARGQREALMQNMAARGLGGSNAELAAALGSDQAQTQRYATQDAQNRANMLGQVQNRALNSISQMGSLGNQVRGQSFGEGARRAEGADAFNKNNTQFYRDVSGAMNQRGYDAYRGNIGSVNDAQWNQYNARGNEAGNIANQYMGESLYNEGRRQESNQDQRNRTAGLVGAGTGIGLFAGGGSDDDDRRKGKY